MKWFSAHLIMYIKFKHKPQRYYPVWENIVLVAADSAALAFEKAESLGRTEESFEDSSLRCDGRPARWVFAGVRKLVECESTGERPGDGTEVTYNELILDSIEAVEKLAAGDEVTVVRGDRFPLSPEENVRRAKGSSRGRSKPV